MSKYEKLWNYFTDKTESVIILSYEEIEKILGFPIDHSFLTFKKELITYGYQVDKISLKEKTVRFIKTL
jgi:hypothetical protein